MKKISSLLSSFLLLSSLYGQFDKDTVAERYAATITATDLSEYLHVLASDSLEGRETGHAGQKKAAAYISGKFAAFGAGPGMGNSYYQPFDLLKKEWDDVYVKVKNHKKLFLKDFFIYGDLNFPEEMKTEAVFAGYGIDAPGYSDYKPREALPLEVAGKAVIIFPGEPVVRGRSLVTGDSSLSSWANDWRKKVEVARTKGAKAVFIVTGKNRNEFEARLAALKEHIAKPTLGFTYKERPSAFFIPVELAAQMQGVRAEELMESLELRPATQGYTSVAAKTTAPRLKPAKLSFKCSVKTSKFTTENVLGFIEGTDKKEEVVVLTAHYDHLGIENGRTCYGADDDGSGTSALLEIAQAFATARKEGHGPRRSILIMAVTAEEKGLMGSEYYADFPVYPLKNTVADLNVDMIGRLDRDHLQDTNYVYLIGSNRLSTDLHRVSEDVNRIYTNIHLDYRFNSFNDPNRFYYRSDHYNFAKNRVPVIFYFSGVHEDYHKPTDTVDKIIFPKMEKITRLIFYTAWELANMEKGIEVNVTEE